MEQDKYRRLTQEEILKLPGKMDDIGFYILEGGDFYDPDGYYFDEKGYDKYGGYYDDDGVYVPHRSYASEYFESYRAKNGESHY